MRTALGDEAARLQLFIGWDEHDMNIIRRRRVSCDNVKWGHVVHKLADNRKLRLPLGYQISTAGFGRPVPKCAANRLRLLMLHQSFFGVHFQLDAFCSLCTYRECWLLRCDTTVSAVFIRLFFMIRQICRNKMSQGSQHTFFCQEILSNWKFPFSSINCWFYSACIF